VFPVRGEIARGQAAANDLGFGLPRGVLQFFERGPIFLAT
jgi:hypothetical protein